MDLSVEKLQPRVTVETHPTPAGEPKLELEPAERGKDPASSEELATPCAACHALDPTVGKEEENMVQSTEGNESNLNLPNTQGTGCRNTGRKAVRSVDLVMPIEMNPVVRRQCGHF